MIFEKMDGVILGFVIIGEIKNNSLER